MPCAACIRSEAQGLSNNALYGCGSAVQREGHAPTEEVAGVQVAENGVGVGHRRVLASEAVAGGAGCCPCALRTDSQAARVVEPGYATATCRNLGEVYDRDFNRVTGALEPAPHVAGATDLVFSSNTHFAVVNQGGLGCGASHVEGDELI